MPRLATAAALSAILALSACAPIELSPTPTPTPDVPAQPSFAPSPVTVDPAEAATASTGTASLSADFAAEGTVFDPESLLKASQGGYEPMSNLNWFAAQASQLSSMGINEIRLDHIFNDNFYNIISIGADGVPVYDFSRLDQVVSPLMAAGIDPFFVLAYRSNATPAPLYSGSSLTIWAGAVEALVAHYRDLGHPGLSYEVWNEVDVSWPGPFTTYATFYTASAEAVKRADPTAKVGGAAASDLGSGTWSTKFIDFLGANPGVPADFFSVHSYRRGNWEPITTSRALLAKAGRPGLPVLVTEWNLDSSMDSGAGTGSDTNSSVNGSSYIAKRMALAAKSGGDKFFYFSPVEGFDHTKAYNGDLGLVTVDGHRKSLGNVFQMFSELENTLVAPTISGNGTAQGNNTGIGMDTDNLSGIVTKSAENQTATVLLWNNTPNNTTMSVSLANLPYAASESNFRVVEKTISSTKGNGFADTSTVVAPSYPSASENAPVTSDTVLASSADFAKDVLVPANGVVTLTLAPSEAEAGEQARSAEPAAINLAAAASGATVTASTSIEEPDNGWAVTRLTDGERHAIERTVPARGWSSASHTVATEPESVNVDLGATKSVDTVVLWPRDSQEFDGTGFPTDFTIEGSVDGEEWTTAVTETGYNGGLPVSGAQTFSFPAAEYRYLRMTATLLSPESTVVPPTFGFQLAEFEAYRLGIPNGGFEEGTLDGWSSTGVANVLAGDIRSGAKAVQLAKPGSAVSTTVEGLLPDTTYTFGTHARLGKGAGIATISASEFGGDRVASSFTSTNWASNWVTFTTGPDATSAVLEFTLESGSKVTADDFILTQAAAAAAE
ncbi:hypothetical protein HD599_003430 [Conyzicola lurida]|uniref:F5/8 type C domain-containing protein n=1 Tax=Conyzicola lurida TaxID=1172621 RepID=A0A841API9_9MICO|nr:discoidin domain-containing protein [Conyzicola lurida]MBB5845107.1 hypothetical protein [Conyzicola lurida]